MVTPTYTATKTRSNRPGWSVIFAHPRRRDARGKLGLKVRRGLKTREEAEADRLVGQLNALLADQTWWSLDRREEAARLFDEIIISAFYDRIEVGKDNPRDLREMFIPLPTPENGYARVMLVGPTGAGKTTLLRQLIGSHHTRDRFPSTSTAKTTTADIEIITSATKFEAVATFMNEHEVRCAVDECLEEACMSVVRGGDDTSIVSSLLEHREQRFRLSYIIGSWQPQRLDNDDEDYEHEMDYEYEEAPEAVTLGDSETIDPNERLENNERLAEYVERIKKVSKAVREGMIEARQDYDEMGNANQRQDWLEAFIDALYEDLEFAELSLDIMDAILKRFAVINVGEFERSASGWPTLWYYEEQDREAFLRHVRWFSSNHDQQFGRLLTPLIDGIRVSGPFCPSVARLQDDDRRLVFLDGEGLGHSAKEAFSISTSVTEKFSDVDMILLVDHAQSPMQAAPLELLRSVGSSGHAHKLAVAFTHFDQVKGDNLSSYAQKRNHVRASIGNAVGSLRDTLGAPVAEILERQLGDNDFYLGSLDGPTDRIPGGFINGRQGMRKLLERMQRSAEPPVEPVDLAPIYTIAQLELALRDAADGFKNPWRGRLGLGYYENTHKEHWGRVKALCRRIVNGWDKNEYDGLRPSADLVRQLQTSISRWLDNPITWIRPPVDQYEGQTAIDAIRRSVSVRIHVLVNQRLITARSGDWRVAYEFKGLGSSFSRARVMGQIYESAAPSVSSAMDGWTQQFFDEVTEIVVDAVRESGGSVEGVLPRETVESI